MLFPFTRSDVVTVSSCAQLGHNLPLLLEEAVGVYPRLTNSGIKRCMAAPVKVMQHL